jgi:hypothetical protein
MSLEMAHKVILPPKKNYIPQFLKQRDINSYYGGQELSRNRVVAPARQSWNFKESMGARNRGGIVIVYRPARLHRLAEFILGIDSWAP